MPFNSNGGRTVLPFKRETTKESAEVLTLKILDNKKESLSKTCIWEVYLEDKKLGELTPEELGQVIGKMDEKYTNLEFTFKVPLTARTRIEVLIRDLFPKNMCKPESVKECMIIILKSGARIALKLFDEVLCIYGSEDPEASIRIFAEAVEYIFRGTSSVGAYSIMDSEILKTFRSGPEKTSIKLLDRCNVPSDSM